MRCEQAQRLLSNERDNALTSSERVSVREHVAHCSTCERFSEILSAAADAQRTRFAAIQIPDSERAWQDIRRELRQSAGSPARSAKRARWWLPLASTAALAAVAVAFWFNNSATSVEALPVAAQNEGARVEFVDVPSTAASMVYVDEESGWVVVWATNSDATETNTK